MTSANSPSRLLVMTVLGADHPGIVDRLSRLIRHHNGNWLESRMARLGGQFAGIVAARVPASAEEALQADLDGLAAEGLSVIVQPGSATGGDAPDTGAAAHLQVEILCPDRPGILRELTGLLAEHAANVEELSTRIVPAEFSGDPLFKARIRIALASTDEREPLREAIQELAIDLALDLSIEAY